MDFGPAVYPGSWLGLGQVRAYGGSWAPFEGSWVCDSVGVFVDSWMGSWIRGFVSSWVRGFVDWFVRFRVRELLNQSAVGVAVPELATFRACYIDSPLNKPP